MTQLSNAPGVYCDVQQELDDSVPTIVFYLDLQHTVGLSNSGKTNLILSLNTSLGSSNISLSVVSFVPVGIERNFRDALLDLKDTRELGSFARYSLVKSLPGSPVSPDGCFLRLEVDFDKVSRNFESVPLSSSGKSKLIVSTKGPLKIGNTTTQLNMFICERRRMFVAGLYELAQNPIIKVHDSDVKNVVISVNCASLLKKEKKPDKSKTALRFYVPALDGTGSLIISQIPAVVTPNTEFQVFGGRIAENVLVRWKTLEELQLQVDGTKTFLRSSSGKSAKVASAVGVSPMHGGVKLRFALWKLLTAKKGLRR